MRNYIGLTVAATLLASTNLALADDLPLGAEGRGSPMDFIIHSQPAKFPHHIKPGTSGHTSSSVPAQRTVQPAPSAAELQWMERASRGSGN